ncbi:MAG: hypothetical protein BJ554DRAFT_5615 [Olpidium bornovanus]|uniref:PIN domain-containing protein n=1 Tax=Olpidium bornovanus TaxID=278681 RepID=A0A8H7ZZB1_9FUNG|nr:MAG: hypothetical protein BJ554DRAFT_5615 [Olpidium bornovanus]
MRAMAQQLLKDQVSHLEQNLGNVSVSGMARVGAVKPRDVVVDVTVLLEQFPVLKRILSSGKYHVTLLLNELSVGFSFAVIDELDVLKKGTGVVNVRAREAVRYLDHTLSKRGPSRTPPPASRGGRRDQQQQHQKRTMLRVQRHNERLPAWSAAAEFLLPPTGALDAAAAASPDHPFTFEHVSKVPKRLRDAISCCLWRRKAGACGQEDATGQAAVVTLVTEDAEQAEFAARFGIETCRTRDLPC